MTKISTTNNTFHNLDIDINFVGVVEVGVVLGVLTRGGGLEEDGHDS